MTKSLIAGEKLRGKDKILTKFIEPTKPKELKHKPPWLRIKISHSKNLTKVMKMLKTTKLNTVCEEAACPNLNECFSSGTATFMIMGDICTRRCSFCNVAFGRPNPLDKKEPLTLAKSIKELNLDYVVITSVDRDDLSDGGAQHFIECIKEIRKINPNTKVEILTPDFKKSLDKALEILGYELPDTFNHNLETIKKLYKGIRIGADYDHSLNLLQQFKEKYPAIYTKSGIMVGLGENKDEVFKTLEDLKKHKVDIVTIGQYLQPSLSHIKVDRYVHPNEFDEYKEYGLKIGFHNVISGPLIRSSYHANTHTNN